MHTYMYIFLKAMCLKCTCARVIYIYIHAFTRRECLSEDDCKPCRQLSGGYVCVNWSELVTVAAEHHSLEGKGNRKISATTMLKP